MTGRHADVSGDDSPGRPNCDSDRCLICGRKYPTSFSPVELAASAESYRRVQRAAAGVRLVTDRRLSEVTPSWVHDLAAEERNAPLPVGWEAHEIRRLEEEARAACPCQCHGPLTERELQKAARHLQEMAEARAQLRGTLDRRLGRSK